MERERIEVGKAGEVLSEVGDGTSSCAARVHYQTDRCRYSIEEWSGSYRTDLRKALDCIQVSSTDREQTARFRRLLMTMFSMHLLSIVVDVVLVTLFTRLSRLHTG